MPKQTPILHKICTKKPSKFQRFTARHGFKGGNIFKVILKLRMDFFPKDTLCSRIKERWAQRKTRFVKLKQLRQDFSGFCFSTVNCGRTMPVLGISALDYIYNLRGLEYPSEEYTKTRAKPTAFFGCANKNGGIYLKTGQYLGSLETLLPKEYTDTLKVLQDKAPNVALEKIKVVIETDFGKTLEEIFSSFDPTPIAAASLAQVHKAVLRKSGEEVAVKIQFPTLRVQTYYDMIVMSFCLKVVARLTKWYRFRGLNWVEFFDNFKESLSNELDFIQEANNAMKTREEFEDDDRLYIPNYYLQFSGKRMLVMEFIKNTLKVSEAEEIKKKYGEKQAVELSKTLIDIFSKMIFITGHIHADAHPGNILIREHPKNPKIPQVVLIDHGLYCNLTKEFIDQFRRLWFSMVTFDNVKMKEIAHEMGLGEHYRFLPLLFTYRTINSTKPLGGKLTDQERRFLKVNDEMNFEKIGMLTEKLPSNICFIFKTAQYTLIHNKRLGGSIRYQLISFSDYCIQGLTLKDSILSYYSTKCLFYLKMILFEYFFGIYKFFFGFYVPKFDENNEIVIE